MNPKINKRVILDVNHPADVHFIKNLYFDLIKKDYTVLVVASKKPLTYELLAEYDIPHQQIGTYGTTNCSKAFNWIWLNLKMLLICLRFRPSVILGTVSFRGAFVGWLLNIKSYCFDDTQHATKQIALIKPFAYRILTAPNYIHNFGEKHIRYNGYHELAYLHPNRYIPDPAILDLLGVKKGEKYIVIRFVAWNATHDAGIANGFTDENKVYAVTEFLKHGKVFISSEEALPDEIKKYAIKIPFTKIHDMIYYSSLVFGESSTMASEAAVLGVPAIFLDNSGRCYTDEQEKRYGLVVNYKIKQQKAAIEKAVELLKLGYSENKAFFDKKREQLLHDKIDVTEFQLSLLEKAIS